MSPSRDPINPKVNSWMSSDQGRRSATARAARGQTGSPTGQRAFSASVLRLAKKLGLKPEELAEKIPADTLRRLKYPVREKREADGSTVYERDLDVSEGLIPLVRK
jgi:hypothetical protein